MDESSEGGPKDRGERSEETIKAELDQALDTFSALLQRQRAEPMNREVDAELDEQRRELMDLTKQLPYSAEHDPAFARQTRRELRRAAAWDERRKSEGLTADAPGYVQSVEAFTEEAYQAADARLEAETDQKLRENIAGLIESVWSFEMEIDDMADDTVPDQGEVYPEPIEKIVDAATAEVGEMEQEFVNELQIDDAEDLDSAEAYQNIPRDGLLKLTTRAEAYFDALADMRQTMDQERKKLSQGS